MKKVKEPAPHVKAAQIEKEAVRALSEKEVEEALTKSTYGGEKKLEPLDEDDNIIKDIEAENERLRRDNLHLRRTIEETGMAERNKGIEVLKTECLDLKEENRRLKDSIDQTNGQLRVRERELDEAKKTISKMKYAHDEEVRALEDDLAESKILGKKAGEYSSMLDADSDTFETILELAKIIHGLAKNAESVSLLIKDEVEGHI